MSVVENMDILSRHCMHWKIGAADSERRVSLFGVHSVLGNLFLR